MYMYTGIDPHAATAEELRERIDRMLDKFMTYVRFRADDKEIAGELDAMRTERRRRIVMS